MKISFTVDVNPLPKQRPRLGLRGNTYTPQKTRDYEQLIAQHAMIAMHRANADMLEGDIELTLRFYRKDDRRVDLDNLIKACSDAMNGIIYYDDSQIVSIAAKVIRNCGKSARVEIEIESLLE